MNRRRCFLIASVICFLIAFVAGVLLGGCTPVIEVGDRLVPYPEYKHYLELKYGVDK